MARPDKRDKQLKRARSELDSALSRGRLADAADALLMLPADERAGGVASVAARLAEEHERLLRARELGPLLAWCSRCEREPRLAPAGPAELGRVHWCWLVASIRSGHWPRARAILAKLEPALAGRAVYAALAAFVSHDGHPEPSALEAFASESQRLGYDPPAKRSSYPCPAAAAEVEAACLSCFALEPWQRFRVVMNEWLARAPREVAREILGMAVALSRRELAAARDPSVALEVARWCALWCLQAESPPAMEPMLALCVRSAAQALVGTLADRRVVEVCTPIVAAALSYPALVEPIAHVALAPLYALELADAAVLLLRPLVERAPSPRAILKLSGILAMQEAQREEPVALPPWLGPAFERLLQEPDRLAAALGEPAVRKAAHYLLDALPLALTVRACVALFPAADERARELLARAAEDAAVRMRERPLGRGAMLELRGLRAVLERFDPDFTEMSDAELRRYLATPEGKALQREMMKFGNFDLAESVSETLRPELERLAEPLLPYSAGLLDELLVFCGNLREERALVARFWSRRPSLSARFSALMEANQQYYDRALAVLGRELVRDYRPEAEDAARALMNAERIYAPRPIRKKIAEALMQALAEKPSLVDAAQLAEALRFAVRLVKPRAPRASAKRKQPGPAAKPKARASAKKAAAPTRQGALFREEGSAP